MTKPSPKISKNSRERQAEEPQVSQLIQARVKKLRDLAEAGIPGFATGFKPDVSAQAFAQKFAMITESDVSDAMVRMAGRIIALRIMGKATFLRLRDASGDVQAYLARDTLGADDYKLLKQLDIGDIIGLSGVPFRTHTGELSVNVKDLKILTKALRPLPEKWHGLTDVETRYRQRYVDLIVNPKVREIVRSRTRIITEIRNFLTDQGFLEVETPMMQSIPGGATAKPFVTYHHSLDRNLYLRIAPELYLKRLLVGGFDKIFEINRNFRNEGISTQHNPEFTMLEFYQAYATYSDLMAMIEQMVSKVALEVLGTLKVTYDGQEVNLTPPWDRMTVREALLRYADLTEDEVDDRNSLFIKAVEMGLQVDKDDPRGKLWMAIFDEVVENKLWGPVFVCNYPVEVSPLARRNEDDPTVTDRFELYICGREIANAFTELTDPLDQRSRFEEQVLARAAGDEEAHFLDEDFLRALEFGMPPAAGAGVGIDRVVMLLTDSRSIREVILFPHMRPEKGGQ